MSPVGGGGGSRQLPYANNANNTNNTNPYTINPAAVMGTSVPFSPPGMHPGMGMGMQPGMGMGMQPGMGMGMQPGMGMGMQPGMGMGMMMPGLPSPTGMPIGMMGGMMGGSPFAPPSPFASSPFHMPMSGSFATTPQQQLTVVDAQIQYLETMLEQLTGEKSVGGAGSGKKKKVKQKKKDKKDKRDKTKKDTVKATTVKQEEDAEEEAEKERKEREEQFRLNELAGALGNFCSATYF